jgi:hypothetical protein
MQVARKVITYVHGKEGSFLIALHCIVNYMSSNFYIKSAGYLSLKVLHRYYV